MLVPGRSHTVPFTGKRSGEDPSVIWMHTAGQAGARIPAHNSQRNPSRPVPQLQGPVTFLLWAQRHLNFVGQQDLSWAD